MTGVFGDLAHLHDDARPSYPAGMADAVQAYADTTLVPARRS
jgi:hypothetical protein